jgi:sugar phosphate isomerase/epimerase
MLRETYLPHFLLHGLNPEIGMDWQSLDQFGTEDYIGVVRPLQEAGLKINIHGPFIDLAPGAIDPLIREVTKRRISQVLNLLPIFQPSSVVFHGGFDQRRYREIEEQWVEGALDTWSQCIDLVEGEGIPIMIENVYEKSPEFIARIFEAIDSPYFRFCFDTGHFNLWSETSLETWLQRLGDRIGEIHLHDNHGIVDEHLAIGSGSFDFKALFEWIRHEGLQPLITLEPHNEEDVEASIENLAKYL